MHLPSEFITQIVKLYENTRLGQQEIFAVFLDITEGVWFAAEIRPGPACLRSGRVFDPIYNVRCAIERRRVAAHGGRVLPGPPHNNGVGPPRVTAVFTAITHALDVQGEPEECLRNQGTGQSTPLPWQDRKLRAARPGRGGFSERRSGRRPSPSTSRCSASAPAVARWPRHMVLDGLKMLDLLLEGGKPIDPSTVLAAEGRLSDLCSPARPTRRRVDRLHPADGHPEEDMIDALRGGVRDAFPEGLVPPPNLSAVHAGRVLG